VEDNILIIASSMILSAHIGRALAANQFKDWQVADSADEGQALAGKISPTYIVLDVVTVKGDLGDYCKGLAETSEAGIILILNQPSAPQFLALMADARSRCPQIIAAFEFPLDANQLVNVIAEHHRQKLNPPAVAGFGVGELPVVPGLPDASEVGGWIRNHPEIISCAILSSDGQVLETHGQVPEGQGIAAHYLMGVARSLGGALGLTNLTEIHQHGPNHKFLMMDSGRQLIAVSATSKIDLKVVAEKFTTTQF
jgi:predicted regulator of Ras-like GTPase activity (Roadblock/LC7/MglB family)